MLNILDLIIYGGLTTIFIVIFLGIAETVKRLDHKMKRIELYLDLILEKLEIQVPDLLSERVKQLALNPQKKIEALKLYHTKTGASLKESKEAIETFIRQHQQRNR